MFLFFLLLLLLPTAAWYLTSSAVITQWLWRRYPAWLDTFLHCTACSGFWWGMLVSLGFTYVHRHPYPWYTAPIWGLVVLVTNPLMADLHTRALTPTSASTDAINRLEIAVTRLAASVEEQLKRDAEFNRSGQAEMRLDLQGVIKRPVY